MVKFTFGGLSLLSAFFSVLLVATSIWVQCVSAMSKKSPQSDPQSQSQANSIWVSRADGGQSCSPGSGQSLDEGAALLRKSKVRVLDSRKGNDGKMHIQVCGAPTGSANSYLIPREDIAQAVAQGFKETPPAQ